MLLFNFFSLYDDLGVFMVEISVVIPAYNAVAYLDEAINSIINQSFTDLEIICVDDGSTDNTLDVLQSYASKDSRVQVHHQENQGPGGATNTGLSKAKGKYIFFMDSDDILDLNALEELYNIMEEKDVDFVIFKAITYDENQDKYYEESYFTMPQLYERVGDSVFDWRDLGDEIFNINVTPWSKLYKHELIKKSDAQFPPDIIYQDNIFFFEILFNSSRIYFYDKCLYTRRVHSSSLVHSNNEKNIDIIKANNLLTQTFIDYGHFEEFKKLLYNKKIYLVDMGYQMIKEDFKELFFVEMKKDFEKIIGHEKYDDFYSNLSRIEKEKFDNVIESNNHVEYDLRTEISSLRLENDKIEKDRNSLKFKNDYLKKKGKSLDEKNKNLNEEIDYLTELNKSLVSSKSWRLTKPLRSFMKLFRK